MYLENKHFRNYFKFYRCNLLAIVFVTLSITHGYSSTNDIRFYYSKIHKAELQICEGNFNDAISNYEAAFSSNIYFARDIYKALICIGKVNNFKAFKKISHYAIKVGIPVSFFNKTIFKEIKKHHEYSKIEKYLAKLALKIHKKTRNYREKIDYLLELDQLFRVNENLDSMVYYDHLIFGKFNEYIASYGFPSERKIGVYMKNDTVLQMNSAVDIILLHQIKNKEYRNIDDIIQFIHSGEMRSSKLPFFSSWLPGFQKDFGCYNQEVVYVQLNNLLYQCSKERENEIDKNREEYYMEPIKDLKIKINWHYFKDASFLLTGYNIVKMERDDSNSTIEELKKSGLELLKVLDDNRFYFKSVKN